MSSYSHKEYDWMFNLMRRQKSMLTMREAELIELYRFCDDDEQRRLIEELLIRFYCLEPDVYAMILQEAVNYICSLGYNAEESALVAFCHDSSADSSQVVLDDMKVPMALKGYSSIRTINRFDRIERVYKTSKGSIKHYIAVDEFAGSGQTLESRVRDFNKLHLQGVSIDYVFLTGMKDAIAKGKQLGNSVFAVLEMEKGISDYYKGVELDFKRSIMQTLERKLAAKINNTDLQDYLFGYHRTESLYCRPNKNVPNNDFPIF